MTIKLDWQRVSELEEPYYVGLRLVDSNDYTWAQRSAEPVGGLRPFSGLPAEEIVRDRHGLILTADTPPGEYHVKVGVYRRSDGRGLDLLSPGGSPVGVEADLGAVRVTLPEVPPDLERVPVATKAEHELASDNGEAVRLIGYSLTKTDYVPGDALAVVLFWQPVTPFTSDVDVNIQLVDLAGQPVVSQANAVVFGRYLARQWTVGYPVRDPQQLIIPPQTSPGDYTIRIGLSQAGAERPFVDSVSGSDFVNLQRITVSGGRPHNFTSPQVPYTLQATWGEDIQLIGYGPVSGRHVPGGNVVLPLYWRSLGPINTSYTIFVHLLDEHQQIRGQADSVPGTGTLPTTGWIPGEYLQDSYAFQIQKDAPPGSYHLEVGVYDADTGSRLPVRPDGDTENTDHIIIPVDIDVTTR